MVPDPSATLAGILVVALATYATRVTGYLLGSRIVRDSTAARVLDTLPGAALAGVLALSLTHASPMQFVAVAATAGLFLCSGRTLPALGAGLAVSVASAHLLP